MILIDLSLTVPHRKLPRRVLWFYFGHMVAFTIVFLVVYISVKNTHQENCNEKYEIDTFWRPLMGGFAGLNLVIGWLGWYILYQNIKVYYDENSEYHRATSHSGVLWFVHLSLSLPFSRLLLLSSLTGFSRLLATRSGQRRNRLAMVEKSAFAGRLVCNRFDLDILKKPLISSLYSACRVLGLVYSLLDNMVQSYTLVQYARTESLAIRVRNLFLLSLSSRFCLLKPIHHQ